LSNIVLEIICLNRKSFLNFKNSQKGDDKEMQSFFRKLKEKIIGISRRQKNILLINGNSGIFLYSGSDIELYTLGTIEKISAREIV